MQQVKSSTKAPKSKDGVLANCLIFDQRVLCRLPEYLNWTQVSIIPCAGVTAWAAMEGFGIGKNTLIKGTGGVSMFAVKLARAVGLKIFLTSSKDKKLEEISPHFPEPLIQTINYSQNPNWHEEVLRLTEGASLDLVIEVGGASTLLKSLKCTRRRGTVSQAGYLGKQAFEDVRELLPTIIDRKVCLTGIYAGSKIDLDDLCTALSASRIHFDDIIDSVQPFDSAEEAIEKGWQG